VGARATRCVAKRVEIPVIPAPPRALTGLAPIASSVESAWGAEGLRLLTVARLAPQKGISLLLDAAAALQVRAADGEVPAFAWALAGEGPQTRAARERVGVENLPVRLLGGREDVPVLLQEADIVIQTSLWEGQPLIVQEAMRAGERVTVAVQVVACEDKAGETWRLRVLTLGDGPRRVEAAFWNERKDEIDHILAGQVVVVAGTVRTRSVPDADGGPDTVVRSLSATSLWIPDIPTGTTRPFAHSGIDEALERLCELSVPAAHQ